jgi:catechol 2,3-dioxygenase-like lactoylglutathione lyase family enzyme
MTSEQPVRGIPGLLGTDHVGFTVPDIEEATRFFVEVIGCDYLFSSKGPFPKENGWMRRHLNVDPRSDIVELRFLRCRHGSNFEIFQYTAPRQRRTPPRNSDVGGHHLAFYVEDFDAALAYLRSEGVRILGEPTCRQSGPNAGMTWVYFLSPWGMQLELVSYPEGRGYERGGPHRLWDPRRPAD